MKGLAFPPYLSAFIADGKNYQDSVALNHTVVITWLYSEAHFTAP